MIDALFVLALPVDHRYRTSKYMKRTPARHIGKIQSNILAFKLFRVS
jgi:hypothetical protein